MAVLRLKGISGVGMVFVTTTIAKREPRLRPATAAQVSTTLLNDTVSRFGGSLVGYVVMSNHVHFLAVLADLGLLSKLVQTYKSLTSRAINRMSSPSQRNSPTLWMRRFDDLIVRSERQFNIKLNYIHQNPVRAQLVTCAFDWEYSSARQWETGESGPIEVDTSFEWLQQYEGFQS
jgi:REP element-mobilizing transposase RayT